MGKKVTTVVAVTLVAIAGVAGYFILNGGKDTNTQQTSEAATKPTQTSPTKDISAIIVNTNSLGTLNSLVQLAAIDQTLQEVGPYTVLAPTNQAFEMLPAATLTLLKKPDNAKLLERILTYHVIPGKLLTSQLTDGQKLKTVNGQELVVDVAEGAYIFIDAKGNKAAIEKADMQATNGVVHVVSAVVLPQ